MTAKQMKAIQADDLSSIDSYRVVELDVPEPGPGEVRIKIAACGVGYVDALVSLGRYQVKPPLPHVPGGEVAGWIDSVGSGVTGFAARRPRAGAGERRVRANTPWHRRRRCMDSRTACGSTRPPVSGSIMSPRCMVCAIARTSGLARRCW